MKSEEIRHALAEAIREECHSQVELWKRVPWLSLQADGRSGFGPNHYMSGYLPVASRSSLYTVYLDLDTGDLVNARYASQLAADDEILDIRIDAAEIVAKLEERAQAPTWKGYDEKEHQEWRQQVAKNYGIAERYERNGPRVDLKEVWD